MSDLIEVKVTKYAERRFIVMYYDCPLTGKRVTRSTKQEKTKEAEKAAAKWEAELREGRYRPLANITFEDFRDRYEAEAVPALAEKTGNIIATALNALERILNPQKLRGVNEERLSYFQAKLREEGLSESSIRSYLAHIRSALSWAVDMKLLPAVPKIKLPRRAKGSKLMKGRAITGEEFERMLAKVDSGLLAITRDAYRPRKTRKKARSEAANARRDERQRNDARAAAPSWERLLRGLWLSGLRLGEALNLSWDDESKILVILPERGSRQRPMLRIRAELEKGGQDRLHPLTPDIAEMLWATPEADRTGAVFPIVVRGQAAEVTTEWASKVISEIGKAAGVVVDKEKGKFASAHDLRRSFGERWAKRVMPAVLQQMMRHSDIKTTMAYYAEQNAAATADAVWDAQSLVSSRLAQNQLESADVS